MDRYQIDMISVMPAQAGIQPLKRLFTISSKLVRVHFLASATEMMPEASQVVMVTAPLTQKQRIQAANGIGLGRIVAETLGRGGGFTFAFEIATRK